MLKRKQARLAPRLTLKSPCVVHVPYVPRQRLGNRKIYDWKIERILYLISLSHGRSRTWKRNVKQTRSSSGRSRRKMDGRCGNGLSLPISVNHRRLQLFFLSNLFQVSAASCNCISSCFLFSRLTDRYKFYLTISCTSCLLFCVKESSLVQF